MSNQNTPTMRFTASTWPGDLQASRFKHKAPQNSCGTAQSFMLASYAVLVGHLQTGKSVISTSVSCDSFRQLRSCPRSVVFVNHAYVTSAHQASLFLQSNSTHISSALSHTTKGSKRVSDYAEDTESREMQHSQTVTDGNFEKLSCLLQPQEVETACVFCIRICRTIINLLYDSWGTMITVFFPISIFC